MKKGFRSVLFSLFCIGFVSFFASAQTEDLGDFIVAFEDSSSQVHLEMASVYQDMGFFDSLVSVLNDSIALPYDIGVVSAQCDTVNAFWAPDFSAIVMCYELTEYLFEIFRAETKSEQELTNAVLGAVEFIFYHELGHALVDTFDIPFTGREEDAVDQFSTIFLLGTELGVESALSGASFFYLSGSSQDHSELVFWGEHSLDQQRFYDIVCLVYGSDPETYSHLVRQQTKGFMLTSSTGYLPKDRAERCPSEFRNISNSWNTLFATYVPSINTPAAQVEVEPDPTNRYTESFTGSLAKGDAQYDSEEFYDEITVELVAGQEAVFELSSADFDTYLIVRTPDGTAYVNDDFSNENGFTSRITLPVVETGSWTIQVTSFAANEVGNYTMGLVTKDDVYQSIVEDSLTNETTVFSETGEYFHRYEYDFVAGQHIVLALSSTEFDTYLYAVTPGGENIVNDDYETMKALSRIEFDAPETGTYNVYVTTHDVGEVGAYQMVIGQDETAVSQQPTTTTSTTPASTSQTTTTPTTTTSTTQTDPGNDQLNVDITDMTSNKARSTNLGILQNGDDMLDSGEYVDYYSVDLISGQEAIFTLVSADFNTYLGAVSPEGDVIELDEILDDPNRSRLTITPNQTGTWFILVTTVSPQEEGNYLLSIKK